MDDELAKELQELANTEDVELSDEVLDEIAGGFIYHDSGDPEAHRREAYYVIDDKGKIVMRVDDIGTAKHWADNIRTNQRMLAAEQFLSLRKLQDIV